MKSCEYLGQVRDSVSWFALPGDGMSAGAAKHDQIEEGVSTEPVGAVYRGACGLSGSVEAIHQLVASCSAVGDDLEGAY